MMEMSGQLTFETRLDPRASRSAVLRYRVISDVPIRIHLQR